MKDSRFAVENLARDDIVTPLVTPPSHRGGRSPDLEVPPKEVRFTH